MPISYVIDSEADIIREHWSGKVSAQELGDYWRSYLQTPEVLAIRRTVVDLRDATPTFSGPELRDLIATVVDPLLQGRDWQTALVVDRPELFGISRQYQVFAEHYSCDAIFSDLESAEDWLLDLKRGP